MRTLLALALLVTPAATQAQRLATVGDLRRVPPAILADAMLPREHPRIARVEFDTMGPALGGISWINFYSTARAIAHDFCAQDLIRVHVEIDAPDDAPLTAFPKRIGNEDHEVRYRYRSAQGCDGKKPFFAIYSGPVEWGLDGIRNLKAAVDLVRQRPAGQPLPFALSCGQKNRGACAAETRLADIDFGTIDGIWTPSASLFSHYGDLGKAATREGDLYLVKFESGGAAYIDVTVLTVDGEIARIQIEEGVHRPF